MGEWSKSIGEKGEEIVKFIFEEILNFNSLAANQSINCIKGEKHKEKSAVGNKTTHGIDGLIASPSPMEDYLLDIAIISSKYIASEYPKSLPTPFKSHLKDLAYTIECFNNSKLKSDINLNFSNITKTEVIGILVWLSNQSEVTFDIVSKVANIQIDNDIKFDKIFLLDNNKINFLYESVYKTRKEYGIDNMDFVYHNSSLNINSLQENSYGTRFPFNYLYSDIIPLRIVIDGKINLMIYINDDFSEESFLQVLDFAKSFDHLNALDKTSLIFRNYDSLTDENLIKNKLFNFNNYKLDENLSIKKFPFDFRNK